MKKMVSIFGLSLVLFACKKEAVITPTAPEPITKPTIIGLWSGKYGGGTNAPSAGYFMLFRENGTVRVFAGEDTLTAYKAEGAYKISNGTITAQYTYLSDGNSFSITSTVTGDFKSQTGTWGPGPNSTGGGTFYLNKP